MDVFDEFEMKPLTDGLGFHREKEKLADAFNEVEAVENGDLGSLGEEPTPKKRIDKATEALDKLMDSLNTLDKQGITFTDTLPTEQESTLTARALDNNTQVEALKRPSIHPVIPGRPELPQVELPESITESIENVKEDMDSAVASMDAGTRRGSSDSLVGNLKELSVSIPAAILDAIMIFALSLIFLLGMLIATEISLETLIYSLTTDIMTQISAGLLFLVVMQVYVVTSRCLTGCTVGEWTFDCQMGNDQQVKTGYYPLQNVWRSLLMIGTGVVVLPLLSLIARRDLARYLTGLQLYKKTI